MDSHVAAMIAGEAGPLGWMLEHPPLYTAGTSAKAEDLLHTQGFPVYPTGRGGQYTYHGPGQRVVYVMADLGKRPGAKRHNLRAYVQDLEQWIIHALQSFGIKGEVRDGRIGVWVVEPSGKESKIAALGIRVRKGIAFHGIALNVHPNLQHFQGIIPCGIREHGVTSLHALGVEASMEAVDTALQAAFPLTLGDILET